MFIQTMWSAVAAPGSAVSSCFSVGRFHVKRPCAITHQHVPACCVHCMQITTLQCLMVVQGYCMPGGSSIPDTCANGWMSSCQVIPGVARTVCESGYTTLGRRNASINSTEAMGSVVAEDVVCLQICTIRLIQRQAAKAFSDFTIMILPLQWRKPRICSLYVP